ncbi:thiopurine S-methyltransferase [Bordetella sp. N]|uniref:thiopurine S-methyltransferase n=1 Tax=Bordetella sp. N TaxID=1746199 RepID=UPI00070C72AF|nr:thiopurine S-methyltransferase [Bordetella sp. N]ALM84674.1 thiopurine S-methyltransferase [Bordetella sp. N]
MEAQFWLDRWREGVTGFHQERVTPLLPKYWPTLDVPPGGRVLVPLCGKTLDMVWLAQQGHPVLGVELSPLAVEQFFTANGLTPEVRPTAAGDVYRSGNIEILCGDIFALDAQTLAGCAAVYDRAALVALPPDMRARYVAHVYANLAAGARTLLITLDYEQDLMPGPPFAVGSAAVEALYQGHTEVRQLDRRAMLDKEPKFAARGLTWLDTLVFALEKR